ncbi:hypothetical protein AWENTII_009965 [Aspergillus wentii]
MPYMGAFGCCICGNILEYEHEIMFTLREREEWENKTPPITCSTTELEGMGAWLTDLLVIPTDKHYMYTAENQPAQNSFFLSGVGQMGFWNNVRGSLEPLPITVPLSQNTVMIGGYDGASDGVASAYWTRMLFTEDDDQDLHYTPRGYVLHERCWWLAKRLIGASVLERNLNLFAAVLHDRRDDILASGSFGPSEGSFYVREIMTVGAKRFLRNPQRYMRKHMNILEDPRYFHGRDPVNITEIRDLVDEARRRLMMLPKAALISAPIDVQCLIADCIDSQRDLNNMLVAFRWQLPDAYWRGRFPEDIIFEYDGFKNEQIDWQYLSRGVEQLLKTCQGLRNRRRILRLLDGIKKAFLNWIHTKV